ncbi:MULTISPECIES: helix-turn-helix domain-containing protein [Nitrosomonas]|uniref:Helix-turn-helix protein n=1 Tax=Nitrosomonas communis TaxID=44574 RepID=A0A0F7KEX6_9PROT|nr:MULTISPECIES: helix-turn-helix transcriptional regulator [Nitrosomonas]AKH37354.1 XRE family transcriptional regulator [Nitrosomonas communis]TYP78309.1 helix-turn-helix protein [Nitrosomonas communis]UVS62578.1 helix-turn-helix domain-containing protein [Nitrosomonas sp. PLL12]
MSKQFSNIENLRELRLKFGLSQTEFWSAVGITQTGGSKYESGKSMPKPVRELVRLIYVEEVDLAKAKRIDLEIVRMLKEQHPEIYKSIKDSIK